MPVAADRLHRRAPHHQKRMHKVGLFLRIERRVRRIGRARHGHRADLAAALVDVDDRPRNGVAVRVGRKPVELLLKPPGHCQVVRVVAGHELRRAVREPGVQRVHNSTICAVEQHDAVVLLRHGGDDRVAVVGRAIIDHDDADVAHALRLDGGDGALDGLGAVIDGDEDVDPGGHHGRMLSHGRLAGNRPR